MDYNDYNDIKELLNKPIRNRNKIINRRGNEIIPRKHHMTSLQIIKKRKQFKKDITKVCNRVKDRAGTRFFNPYRQNGAFHGCVQALYLLGCNKWHNLLSVREKMKVTMSKLYCSNGSNSWIKFDRKQPKEGAISSKDTLGRIQNNMELLHRLGGLNPYGLKLRQVLSSIDINRDEMGIWHYRLKTDHNSFRCVTSIYDTSNYKKGKEF